MNRKIKIVSDSSCDLLSLEGVDFETAPLKIITAQKEYIDTPDLDTHIMATDLQNYKGKSSTSCPNADDWLNAFGDADDIICVTITSKMSGSYNTACMAKRIYEDSHPSSRVFVLDSLSTGPEMGLIIERAQKMISEGKNYTDICEEIKNYRKKSGLIFVLESMKNLANNGRVSHVAAKMAGLLGIRVLGKASDEGELQILDKCRGESKTFETVISRLREFGLKEGRVKIGHCCCESVGQRLKDLISREFEKVSVELYRCRGLCTFYAENGGLLIGFERA